MNELSVKTKMYNLRGECLRALPASLFQ